MTMPGDSPAMVLITGIQAAGRPALAQALPDETLPDETLPDETLADEILARAWTEAAV
ncbi:hypothetical protein [Dactylosporangium sp. CA-139066]|uniref:hypothetical protein n=1 Tax=Dactylosporangium sp. CA-139066 TaxID=3239930 RepID=UPI003D8EDCB9